MIYFLNELFGICGRGFVCCFFKKILSFLVFYFFIYILKIFCYEGFDGQQILFFIVKVENFQKLFFQFLWNKVNQREWFGMFYSEFLRQSWRMDREGFFDSSSRRVWGAGFSVGVGNRVEIARFWRGYGYSVFFCFCLF